MPNALDPLSQPTRTAKRNLLVVSVLAITYKAFDVTIDKIPVAGLSLTFDNRVFVFLLLVSLLYSFLTFVLYYFIDIKNIEATSHEELNEKRYKSGIDLFAVQYDDKIRKALAEKNPGYVYRGSYAGLMTVLRKIEVGKLYTESANMPSAPSQLFTIHEVGKTISPFNPGLPLVSASAHPKLYLDSSRLIRKLMRKYRRQFLFFKFRSWSQLNSIRLIYLIRNYGTDGILPVGLAIVAILALYELIPVDWLRRVAPPK